MTYLVSDNERAVLHAVMDQAARDLKLAHAEICNLQNLDPTTHDWTKWSPQVNRLRWFDAIREKFPAPPDPGSTCPTPQVGTSSGCVSQPDKHDSFR